MLIISNNIILQINVQIHYTITTQVGRTRLSMMRYIIYEDKAKDKHQISTNKHEQIRKIRSASGIMRKKICWSLVIKHGMGLSKYIKHIYANNTLKYTSICDQRHDCYVPDNTNKLIYNHR